MKGLSRRQRHHLAALGRQIIDEDPGLAAQLSRPPVPRREAWAARLGSVMFVAGLVLLASGFLFTAVGAGLTGTVLLLTSWMPPRIVAPDAT